MIFGAMNFPIKPVLQEIEKIAKLGFDYCELTMDPPQAHATAIRDQKDAILGALETAGDGAYLPFAELPFHCGFNRAA